MDTPDTHDLATIQRAARAERITWRYHALRRATERGITRALAVQVITKGKIIEQRPRAKPYPQCLMMKIVAAHRPLYVSLGYDRQSDRIYIITVHWLDPGRWEDPWRRRGQRL